MSDNFLDALDTGTGKKKRQFQRPPSATAVTRDDANKAAGGSQRMHGKKKQLNTRVPWRMFDDLMGRVREQADRLKLSQNDVQMWALLRGLEALESGEEPEMREKQVKRALKL